MLFTYFFYSFKHGYFSRFIFVKRQKAYILNLLVNTRRMKFLMVYTVVFSFSLCYRIWLFNLFRDLVRTMINLFIDCSIIGAVSRAILVEIGYVRLRPLLVSSLSQWLQKLSLDLYRFFWWWVFKRNEVAQRLFVHITHLCHVIFILLFSWIILNWFFSVFGLSSLSDGGVVADVFDGDMG